MKINKQDILLLIIVVLAGYSILQMKGIKTDVESYNNKITLIQQEIDSVQVLNKELTKQITLIDNEISAIDSDIENVTKNITIIKNQTNEKIDDVNEFTFGELVKFFTDRYGSGEYGVSRHDSIP